jgi:chemotaxis protein methyltransferase CheR
MVHQLEITDQDLSQFLERVFETYNFDFREYGKAHLKRRIRHRMTFAKYNSFEDLAEDVIQNKTAFETFFKDLSINVTELFRDPLFFRNLYQFLEQLKLNHPLKIWVSACATGEEAFSMMMMLEHFHISYDCILATDFNEKVVQRAASGRMETAYIKEYLKNMTATEFGIDFYQFFEFKGDYYQLKDIYKEKLEFKYHNLMDQPDFGDFDLVLCRNVLIYFEKDLQNKVIGYITESLKTNGLLCLGAKESLRFMKDYPKYLTIHQAHKIYQKI